MKRFNPFKALIHEGRVMTEQLRVELAAYLEENYIPPEEAGVWPSFSADDAVNDGRFGCSING